MQEISFGEIEETHERVDGGEDIITTVYAKSKVSSIKREIKQTEACKNKDDVLKELLTAAGLVDKHGEVCIIIKKGKFARPYLVTRQWRTSYKKYL